MLTLLQQFLPPMERMRDKLMHGPVENDDFTASIAGFFSSPHWGHPRGGDILVDGGATPSKLLLVSGKSRPGGAGVSTRAWGGRSRFCCRK